MALVNNNELSYIASGMLGFLRIQRDIIYEDKEFHGWASDAFASLNGNRDIGFGMLFNAYTEERGAEKISSFRSGVKEIHADSGGLQIITRGLPISQEIRDRIFEIQGKYSDIAMSFDEIPIRKTGDSSARLSTSDRWFDHGYFKECAKQTGKNLLEQLVKFEEIKTEAKPLLIVHGNCLETYQEWTELCLREVPKDLRAKIGGIALGSAALGVGPLEDIKKAFYVSQLPIEDIKSNLLHVLGVGSISRILPTFVFMKNGLYRDKHITFDSTTHSSAKTFGMFFNYDEKWDFPQTFDPIQYGKMLAIVKKNLPSYGHDLAQFFYSLNKNGEEHIAEGKDVLDYIRAAIAFFVSCTKEFQDVLGDMLERKSDLIKQAQKARLGSAIHSLFEVKDVDTFRMWERDVGRNLKSVGVSDTIPSTLDDFMG